MTSIEESITIDAPPSKVWAKLMDLESWAKWNSFVTSIELEPPFDEISVGSRQKITIQPKTDASGDAESYTNVTTSLIPERELRWRGKIFADFVFYTNHWCLLETREQQSGSEIKTVFSQGEDFGGLLAPMVSITGKMTQLKEGYARMNMDLKRAVENDI
ncbi:hypothetical protein LMH87_002948 [Akanthomyces muscarius]|uniref:SRPBCC domain-containing protein n=1 Tax=Akanthomyces muscarius TaxID=2231603 RepID=A0A9W8Q837_AKAMU|nr:hypothetical protein LMH87_002948 [Akanthomyces muscarius]KAJ4148482.1 hypothetical protein LMH87_002948 [Akanthomyces muscarius]